MLGMDLNMPVTLVVKAPNQKFGDLTVECALGWTIRKLKEHLATVYPNKPVSKLEIYIYLDLAYRSTTQLKDHIDKWKYQLVS